MKLTQKTINEWKKNLSRNYKRYEQFYNKEFIKAKGYIGEKLTKKQYFEAYKTIRMNSKYRKFSMKLLIVARLGDRGLEQLALWKGRDVDEFRAEFIKMSQAEQRKMISDYFHQHANVENEQFEYNSLESFLDKDTLVAFTKVPEAI